MPPVQVEPMPSSLFITLEGPEGAGKTTQVHRLAAGLAAHGHAVTVTREPGGTPLAERIRELLLDRGGGPLPATSAAFLVLAARSLHVAELIRPALAAGRIVICDRFSDATLAYQGYAGGVSLDFLRTANALATGGLKPDLTLLLDLPVETGLDRRRSRDLFWSRFDAADLEFHRRVRQGYLELAQQEPERWTIVDASADPDSVARAIWQVVTRRLQLPLPSRER